jgi:hypothetical protein
MNTSTLFADPSDDFALPKKAQIKEPEEFDTYAFFHGAEYEPETSEELDFDGLLFGECEEDA